MDPSSPFISNRVLLLKNHFEVESISISVMIHISYPATPQRGDIKPFTPPHQWINVTVYIYSSAIIEVLVYFHFLLLQPSTPPQFGGKYCTLTPLH